MNAIMQQFNPSQIAIIDHNGGKWLTSEQLGLALGYLPENARTSINRLYNRHIEEFSEHDSTEVKLTSVDGKLRESKIFSQSGCILASFFANTPNAKAFRAWAKEKLAEPAADSAPLTTFRRPIWLPIRKWPISCVIRVWDCATPKSANCWTFPPRPCATV